MDVIPINHRNRGRGFSAINKLGNGNAIQHVVVDFFIGSEQTLVQHRAAQLRHQVVNRLRR